MRDVEREQFSPEQQLLRSSFKAEQYIAAPWERSGMKRSTFGEKQYLAAAEWSWEQYLGAPWKWKRSTFGVEQ